MDTRYTHTDYYLPELYNKLLKNINVNCKYINGTWSLHQKLEYLNFIKRGLPLPPIVINKTDDGRYELIDGCNRINIICDFMLGGLENYMNAASKVALEGTLMHVYMIYGTVTDADFKVLRRSFHGLFAGFVGAAPPTPPTPSTPSTQPLQLYKPLESDIKIITEKKIIIHQKTKIPKKLIHESLKTGVWNRYIGAEKGSAPCTVCKQTQITQREFDTGHVIAEINGGATHIENLRPICRKCNLSMGAQNMEVFRKKYFS